MTHVVVGSECWPYTGGQSEFEVEAADVRGLIAELDRRFPGLGEFVDRRMAFAIDGDIHQDAWFAKLDPRSEVYLIPKIGGG
jgi:molybdopterin converting factor small subunit